MHRDAGAEYPHEPIDDGWELELGDVVVRDIDFPSDTRDGDLVVVAATGAYCRALASQYNHVPRPPVIAVATKGRYYLRRDTDGLAHEMFDEHGNPSAAEIDCEACGDVFERPDMLASATGDGAVCSLCVATDRDGRHVLPAR